MALEMFLSPLVSLVVDKAANSLIQQFCQMMGMEENREKLHFKLLKVQKVIANAEKKGANDPLVEAFLKKLHAAAYEAVDVLDEFQYEALRQKAIREQPSSSAKLLESLAAVLDVGNVYDPKSNRYNHHQRGFNQVFGHGFSTKFSSGLIWKVAFSFVLCLTCLGC